MLEDYARPRPMTAEERADFLRTIFEAAGLSGFGLTVSIGVRLMPLPRGSDDLFQAGHLRLPSQFFADLL